MLKRVLIAEEELRALPLGKVRDDNRAADGAAELMAVEGILCACWRKIGLGIEVAVAQKLECIAVELIASGLGDDIYHRAGALAKLGVVVAGLHAEFLQRVRERERLVNVRHFIYVVATVQQIVRLG